MKKIADWENVKASSDDFNRPPAGGYICEIVSATDNPDKEYIRLEYDIAEGEFKGHWQETAERFGWWGGDFYRSYKDSAIGMFKGFIQCVEASNEGYKWAWKEKSLVGKRIGIVLGEEEYIKNDGSVATRLKVRNTKKVQDIIDQRFRTPKIKTINTEPSDQPAVPGFTESDEMPF